MTTHRQQFGKRGLPQNSGQTWRQSQSHYSPQGASPAYAVAGANSASFEDGTSYSVSKVFTFALAMLFSFNGRIGRSEYWTIGLIRFLLMIGVLVSFVSNLTPGFGETTSVEFMEAFFSSFSGFTHLILFTVLTVCLYSLETRRCHDRNVSGFWLLLLLVPIIGGFYGLWIFIANGFFAGTQGPNRFDSAEGQARIFE